jgi:hypothetical protein
MLTEERHSPHVICQSFSITAALPPSLWASLCLLLSEAVCSISGHVQKRAVHGHVVQGVCGP